MVTKAVGRFINRPTRTGRGVYDKFFVYVPTELARDSSFQFEPGEEVDAQLDLEKRALTVQSTEKKVARTTKAEDGALAGRLQRGFPSLKEAYVFVSYKRLDDLSR